MVPSPSRRTLLQASGVALATGLAGCSLKYDPVTETTTTRQRFGDVTDGNDGSDGQATDGAENGNQDDKAADGQDGQASGGQSNGDSDGQADGGTPEGVVTYDVTLRNAITKSDLRPAADVAADAPAKLVVRTEVNYDDRDREVIFERSVDLEPGDTRNIEGAFTTEETGVEHVVRAELTPFRDRENDRMVKMSHTAAERFTPGGFGGPKSDTFYVIPRDGERGDAFEPSPTMYTEDPEERG